MSAKILDGKRLSLAIEAAIAATINRQAPGSRPPTLAVVMVGQHPASELYVMAKMQAAKRAGINFQLHHLNADCSEATLTALIEALNGDIEVDGILVQLPLPAHLSPKLLGDIDYRKDVDGFHPRNLGALAQNRPYLRPCTPKGIISLLHSANIKLKGLHCVVVGASNLVGRPMALELLAQSATVTICHSATEDLRHHLSQADLLVSATGQAQLISGADLKPGVIAIDVGISHLQGRLCGDLHFESVIEIASYITPVPGGVGPMTVASLLENTLWAAQNKA